MARVGRQVDTCTAARTRWANASARLAHFAVGARCAIVRNPVAVVVEAVACLGAVAALADIGRLPYQRAARPTRHAVSSGRARSRADVARTLRLIHGKAD